MPRICQLAHVELTYNFLAPLMHALRDEGHEVVAACNLDADGRHVRQYLGDGFDVHRIHGARSLSWRTFTTDVLDMARYLRRERFDLVCVHAPLVSLQARIAARLARVPIVIYQAHGFAFHSGMGTLTYRAAYSVERLFARWLTDAVVTVNEEDAVLARQRSFRPQPDQVVQAPGVGIDIDRFRPAGPDDDVDRKTCRGDLGIPADALVITFIGRLVAEKGLRELISAFRSVATEQSDAYLLIVGDTLDSERDQTMPTFLEQARSNGGGRIVLAGRRTDVARLLRASDIFVLPSYREGMPASLMEAMASGLPCVATRIRGCREAISDGQSGLLVPARDSTALAHALAQLCQSGQLRCELGRAARERAVDRYSIAASLKPQLELYERLLLAESGGRR